MQPQRQLGDLDGRRVDVDAVDIVTQDVGDERRLVDGTARAARPLHVACSGDPLRQQPPECRDQEGARAAGRIDDADCLQTLDVRVRRGGRRGALLRSGIAACRLGVCEPRSERLLDEIVHHRLGRVIDAVALPLRELRDRLAVFQLSFAVLQLGDGLLEDVAESVETDAFLHVAARGVVVAAAKVEERSGIALEGRLVRALLSLDEYVVRNAQAVDERIRLEQSAVDLRQREANERAAGVHQAEKTLEEIPQLRAVFVVERLHAAASQEVPDHLRRKQHPLPHVLAEESEDEAVEQLLRQPQQLAGPAGKIRIAQPENAVETLAHLLVAVVEFAFELAPTRPLPLDETEQERAPRIRQQHVAGEKLGEQIAIETSILRIAQKIVFARKEVSSRLMKNRMYSAGARSHQ